MTQKQQKKTSGFFDTFKLWISTNGGLVTDRLYTRSASSGQSRGIIIEPPTKPVATALFVHGTGNDLTYPSISIFKSLFNERIRICAFDLDGHGHLGTTFFSESTVRDFVTWAIQEVKLSTTDPIFVIGHSLGGTLALAHALQDPKSIQGLVLISAPLALSASLSSLFRETFSCLRRSLWKERQTYGNWGILPALGPFKRAAYPIRLRKPEINYVDQVRATIKSLDLSNKLDSISCPVLLIYGTLDHIVKVNNAYDIQKRIKKSELLLIKGATHFTTILEANVPYNIGKFIKENVE